MTQWQRLRPAVARPATWWAAAVTAAGVALIGAAPGLWARWAAELTAWLGGRWPVVLAAVVAVGFAMVALRSGARISTAGHRREPRWVWLLSDPGVGTAVLVVAALGVTAMVVLLDVASAAGTQPVELAKLRIEAIKYGLGAVAAAGAAAALLLALRRQRHTEQAHELAVSALT